MTRINTNVPSLVAQQRLNRSGEDLQVTLERLSTGLRINRGKDDPAGLIISERIATDIKGTEQAIRNGERASAVISTTEGSLAEITDLLNSIKSLVVEAANTGAISDEEREANQLQINSAIQSITRISNTATFGGLKLLDGSLDYQTSGLTTSTIEKADIFAASFVGADSIDVNVDVITSAQKGGLYLNGDNVVGTDGTLLSSVTLRINGSEGVQQLQFQSGATFESIVSAINGQSTLTGVEAELINGNANSGIVFRSTEYGSDSFVSVERVDAPEDSADDNFNLFKLDANADFSASNPFDWADPNLVSAKRDEGRDVSALINGVLATGDGLNVSINSPTLALDLLLDESYALDPTLATKDFQITGGGAVFQLGPNVNALQQSNIGIQSTSAERLGGAQVDGSIQFLSSLQDGQGNSLSEAADRGDFTGLESIIDKAIDEVSILRGRLGAFERNVLDTNNRSLQSSFENLTASRSIIRDADFAAESSELSRVQILQSAGTTVLSVANQSAQNVLQLLG
ncbi:MAG: flagellin [Planctomycetota bacterium]